MTLNLELNEKIKNVDILISELKNLEDQSGKIKTISILKSAVIMMLYNIIESMLTLILQEIHDNISKESYQLLNFKLKKLYVKYHLTSKPTDNIKKIDGIISDDLKFPTFEEYNSKNSIFSGNLDARKIDELLQLYGIGKIRSPNRNKFLYIKNKRNKLAHGEISYVDACRDKTINEIIIHKESVEEIICEVISLTSFYLSEELYLEK